MRQLFLTSSSDVVMDDIIEKLDKKPQDYKVALIDTASEVEEGDHWWVRAEKDKLSEVGFNDIYQFSITNMTKDEIKDILADKNIIYFCGGNVFYLLDQVIKTGTDEIIRQKIEDGAIYIGSSAGSMIVGQQIDLVCTLGDRAKAPDLQSNGLNIVDTAILPHWGSDYFREEYQNNFQNMYTAEAKITILTDNQYLWVKDDICQLMQI